ncbi:MAG: DUF1801 domain-containing protein [Arcticibacter sp.]
MNDDIRTYNDNQADGDKEICDRLATLIDSGLEEAESKIWHSHPVWFLNGNPIVGYSKQKGGIRLMFWSGADFGIERLSLRGKKFRDASVLIDSASAIDARELESWLRLSREIQWDYKNLVKRKGELKRLK